MHTENVAKGGKLSFQNVGDEGVYDVLTLQKFMGGKGSPRGGQRPHTPLNPFAGTA